MIAAAALADGASVATANPADFERLREGSDGSGLLLAVFYIVCAAPVAFALGWALERWWLRPATRREK